MLGENILKLRKKQGISQEELAEKIDVTRQTISNWELGETMPNPEQLKKLSNIFNVSVDELLDNNINNVIIEKVSNTEKLAGLILKLLKIFGIGALVFVIVLIISFFALIAIRNKPQGRIIEKMIVCELHDEEYSYSFRFLEETGQILEAGGDGYIYNVTNIDKCDDAYQALDMIDAYVKNNGGTCKIIDISEE